MIYREISIYMGSLLKYLVLSLLLLFPSICEAGGSRLFVDPDVVISDGSHIDEDGVISFSIWFKGNNLSSNNDRFFMFRDGNQGFMCVWRPGSNAVVSICTHEDDAGGSAQWLNQVKADMNDTDWHCLQGTVSAGAASKTVTAFYLDGVSSSTSSADGLGSGNDVNQVWIGLRTDSGSGFNGNLAYAQVCQAALTEAEFAQARWYPGTVTNNLKLYLPLFGNSTTEPDLSGNDKDGTATGSTESEEGPPIMVGGTSV